MKVFHRAVWADPAFRVRFRRECEALMALDHPNIVPILDCGEAEGTGYLAMGLASGGSLAALIARGRLAPGRALDVLAGVADALDAAHELGLVHRDVTPSNILLDRSGPWLADFGIARRLDATILTGEGQLVGTAGYMAPEVLAGDRAAPPSDRYALAAVAFAALTGRAVFAGEELAAVLYAHAHRRPPRPSELTPSLPRALDEVMERALAKEPRERPDSAAALVDSLRRALGADPVAATRLMARPRRRRGRLRRVLAPALVASAGLGVVVGGGVAVVGALSDRPAERSSVAVPRPAALTVPAAAGTELAGGPVRPGDLPVGEVPVGARAASVAGARVVVMRGGWEALSATRAELASAGYLSTPLVAGSRTIGVFAEPPLVADLAGLAPRWELMVLEDGSGARALVASGAQEALLAYAGALARGRGDALVPSY